MSSSQSRRLPIQQNVNQAAVNRAAEVLTTKGLGLPCKIVTANDQTVTVEFTVANVTLPNMTLPIAEPLYSRAPYQVGDRGVALPADAALHEASGQSTTQPKFQACGNLGALFFFPISNVTWPASPNKNMYLLQGPAGFLIRSLDGTVSVTGTQGSNLVLAYGGNNATINSSGVTISGGGSNVSITSSGVSISGTTVNITGILNVNGQPYLLHAHTGVMSGPSITGPVV